MNHHNKIKFNSWVFLAICLAFLAGVQPIMAQTGNEADNLPVFRLVREFSFFINFVLIIFVIFLVITLHGALKYLGNPDSVTNKLKLVFTFLKREPAEIFSQIAAKDQHGTYKLPFEKYRQMHLVSRKTLLRTLGLIVLQAGLIAFLVYGLTLLARYTKIRENDLLQSHNFQIQLDK